MSISTGNLSYGGLARLLIFLLLMISQEVIAISSPRVYGGGCGIVQNKLYYVGGLIDINNKTTYSTGYYSLDLGSNFTITEAGEAPWVNGTLSNLPPKAVSPVVLPLDTKMVMIGGDNFYQTLDVMSGEWSSTSSLENGWSGLMRSTGLPADVSLEAASVVQSDTDANLYYIFGGYFKNGSAQVFPTQVWQLDANLGQFSLFADFNFNVLHHTAFAYKNKIYSLGGQDRNGENVSLASINYIDLTNGQIGRITVKGDIPRTRAGHSSVLIGSKVYYMGGMYGNNTRTYFPDRYYVLDLEALSWAPVYLSGFMPGKSGCISYNNNTLIYSFGYFDGLASPKTYLVDLKSGSLTNSFPLQDQHPARSASASQTPTLAIFIGSVVSGMVLGSLTL